MASGEASETSSVSRTDVRQRMRGKKAGALKTAKLNASLSSKIKTKIINNSSTIKRSLKCNNKALAQALNDEKANAQRLEEEKIVLQKELEQCHFQNATLRHKLSFLRNICKELENIAAAVKMARLSELHTSTVSSSNDQRSSTTEDSSADDTTDGLLLRATMMPLRVPVSKIRGTGQQGGNCRAIQITSLDLQRPASSEPQEVVPVGSKGTSPPKPAEMLQCQQEENGKKPTEAMEAEDSVDTCILGGEFTSVGETLCTTKENPNNLPAPAWEGHPLSHEDDEMIKQISDCLSEEHATQRRKPSTPSAASTPPSSADTLPCVTSTPAAWWTIANDNSGSSKSNSQPQRKSPSDLVSPAQTTIIPDKKSLGKNIFCQQSEAKEAEYGAKTNLSYSRIPKFIPINIGSKGKTGKATVKKASTRRKTTNAINTNGGSRPDTCGGEEHTQNAKKLLQLEGAVCSSESEVSVTRQEVCPGSSDKKDEGSGMDPRSDEVRDLRRTDVVDPALLMYSLGSVKLLQEAEKEPVFEMQGVESLSERQVCAFSSHEIPSDDSNLQNSLFLRNNTSDVSRKSIREITKNETKEIRQRENFEEESLPNSENIPEAKAEGEPKRIKTSSRKTVWKGSCDQKKEIDVLVSRMDIQVVAKESTKDSRSNLKPSRKTFVIRPLYLEENLGCVQTDIEVGKIAPPQPIPGAKTRKIPGVQRMTAARNNKNTPVGLQEKEQAKGDNNVSALTKEGCPKPEDKKKRNTFGVAETCSLARQSNGAEALTGSSAELAFKHTVLVKKSFRITDLLSEPDAFLTEQIADTALGENLMSLSCSLDSSSVSCSVASPLSSNLTDVPAFRSLSPGNRMSERSSVWPENSLRIRPKAAEEIPGEGNQIELSSRSSPSQEPEIMTLQDLTNAQTLPSSSSEASGRSLRKRREPGCYAEPKLNSKLRQGDPFTSTDFLDSFPKKTKNTTKAKRKAKIRDKEQLPEGCPSAKTCRLIMGRDMEPEAQ